MTQQHQAPAMCVWTAGMNLSAQGADLHTIQARTAALRVRVPARVSVLQRFFGGGHTAALQRLCLTPASASSNLQPCQPGQGPAAGALTSQQAALQAGALQPPASCGRKLHAPDVWKVALNCVPDDFMDNLHSSRTTTTIQLLLLFEPVSLGD